MKPNRPSATAYRVAMRRAAHQILDRIARRVAAAGEPWKTGFDADELVRELTTMGFSQLEDMNGPALNDRFFGGRERHVGGMIGGRVMTATVAAKGGSQ